MSWSGELGSGGGALERAHCLAEVSGRRVLGELGEDVLKMTVERRDPVTGGGHVGAVEVDRARRRIRPRSLRDSVSIFSSSPPMCGMALSMISIEVTPE